MFARVKTRECEPGCVAWVIANHAKIFSLRLIEPIGRREHLSFHQVQIGIVREQLFGLCQCGRGVCVARQNKIDRSGVHQVSESFRFGAKRFSVRRLRRGDRRAFAPDTQSGDESGIFRAIPNKDDGDIVEIHGPPGFARTEILERKGT